MKSINQSFLIIILIVGVFLTIKETLYIQSTIGIVALILAALSIFCFKKYDEESETYTKCMALSMLKSIATMAFMISFALAIFTR